MNVTFSMELIDNINQVQKGDYVFLIVDQLNPKNAEDEVGHADNSGTVAAVEAGSFIGRGSFMHKMVMLHEIGHNLAFAHRDNITNFMYGYVAKTAIQSNFIQRGELLSGVGINNKVKVGKYKYFKDNDTRLDIAKFLKENNAKISKPDAIKLQADPTKKSAGNSSVEKQ